jgi:hypothetical protein
LDDIPRHALAVEIDLTELELGPGVVPLSERLKHRDDLLTFRA